jgi:hypothetical protein
VLDYHYGRLAAIVTEQFCKIVLHDEHTSFVVLNDYSVKYIHESEMDQQDGAEVMCFTTCGLFEEPRDVLAALYE